MAQRLKLHNLGKCINNNTQLNLCKTSTLKKIKIGFQDQLSLNVGQKYGRMLREHSAILSTFIKLPFVIKISVLSIFEWPFYTDISYFVHFPVLETRIITNPVMYFKKFIF